MPNPKKPRQSTKKNRHKEIPILFQPEMVKSILKRFKYQTRRLQGLGDINKRPNNWEITKHYIENGSYWVEFTSKKGKKVQVKCPYGIKGDVLWVRERWAYILSDKNKPMGYYHSTDTDIHPGPWRPSIFMPREACRIELEILDINIERLQEITYSHAELEGIDRIKPPTRKNVYYNYIFKAFVEYSPKDSFKSLWESINGRGKTSWKKNPWTWVISFKQSKIHNNGKN